MSVCFTGYGSYPPGTNASDLANKTAAFFLISNPGPRTVLLSGGYFAWSPHPYVSTQVRLGVGWTNAEPVPAPYLSNHELAAGKACEVTVVLGTRLLGRPPDVPVPVAATNLVWRVDVDCRRIGLAEQLGLGRLLLCLGNHSPGRVREGLWAVESKLIPERSQNIWSGPIVPP
jgi:hypothetical protein